MASIMNLYSRKIISWTLRERLETKWVLETVEKAKEQRHAAQPLVIHSDRGVQYTCGNYTEATMGMERSYSAKVCPWDNACIESFHALIKREWLSRFRIRDYSHAYRLVFEYIEAFYNTVRFTAIVDTAPPANMKNSIRKVWKRKWRKLVKCR